MKNLILRIFVIAMVLRGTNAFAQFKNPSKMVRNLTHLERLLSNLRCDTRKNVAIINVPPHVVKEGKIGIMKALPRSYTPVTASLISHRKNFPNETIVWGKMRLIMNPDGRFEKKKSIGKGYYTDPTELAADLNLFYHAKGALWEGPDHKHVRFYALPVDGILYQPEGYEHPLVLNSNEYFVIYELASRTGQVVENDPSVYGAYRPVKGLVHSYVKKAAAAEPFVPMIPVAFLNKEPVQVPAVEQPQEPAVAVQESLPIYNQYQQDVAQLRQAGQLDAWWQGEDLAKQYATGGLLGRAVVRFYNLHQVDLPHPISVQSISTHKVGKIYEFPVEGLEIALKNGNVVNIDPQKSVLFHAQDNVFMMLERKQLTNGEAFTLWTE